MVLNAKENSELRRKLIFSVDKTPVQGPPKKNVH